MSAFREWLEAIGRTLGRPVVLRGEDGPIVAAERELERRLASDPGPALLPWARARLVPISDVFSDRRRRKLEGTLYGRPFTVWCPPTDSRPAGHVWVLACWSPEDSGTHRPEVQAACRTCTDALLDHLEPRTIVGPAACVLANEVWNGKG